MKTFALLLFFFLTAFVSARADVIIDNGGPGTSSTGTWRRSGGPNPYGTPSVYSADAGVTYTYAAALGGEQQIFLWWTEYSNRCADVAVDVYDGAALLGRFAVDQRTAGGRWNELPGSHAFSGTARVVINSKGGCTTCADAVKFTALAGGERTLDRVAIEGPASIAENSDANFSLKAYYTDGTSRLVAANNWDADCPTYGRISATGLFTADEVNADAACRISAAYSESGVTGDDIHDITIINLAAAAETIIDNGEPGTSSTGTWYNSGSPDPYGATSRFSGQTGATYTYAVPLSGVYELALWWTINSNRCADVAVDVYDGAALLGRFAVDQRTAGGRWNELPGSHAFSGTARVVINSKGGCTTCADAVKWTRITSGNGLPQAVIETIAPNPADEGDEVAFVGHGSDSDGTIEAYRWHSSIDDTLSSSSSFTSSALSAGIHTITFQVQDDDGAWSNPATQILTVDNNMFSRVFPDENWQTAPPESQGVDSTALASAIAYLNGNSTGIGSAEMVIVRNGYIVWQGASADSFHTLYSGTKAFTSTVLGLLIQESAISSINDPAVDYFPSLDDAYPAYAGITFKQLASFTSGYNADATPLTDMRWGDPRKFLEPTSPLALPGTRFQYFDPAIHQLGNILTVVSGDALENIFRSRIADVIGMSNWEWQHHGYNDDGQGDEIVATFLNPSGIYGGGIHTTPLNLARFGLLYLNKGNWNGQQILSSDWVDEATTNQVPVTLDVRGFDRRGNFGYMWYTNGIGVNGSRLWPSAPPKTYTLRGKERNYCFVVPEWKMVIARMAPPGDTGTVTDQVWEGFFNRLNTGISATPLPF